MVTDDIDILEQETCLLTLDYAYYHVLFCLLQLFVLLLSLCPLCKCDDVEKKKLKYRLRVAHSFGLFAFVADYAWNFMTTGRRIISYPNMARNLDKGWHSGDEPLGPLGELLFFVWFDYSAFGLIIWAKSLEEYIMMIHEDGWNAALRRLIGSPFDVVGLLIVPLQFWTAPHTSTSLNIDSRSLLLTRDSPKKLYSAMMVVFPVTLLQFCNMPLPKVLAIWVSGLGISIVHHAPLFLFGMRGYHDIFSLFLTLSTEWPALVMGIAVVEHVGGQFLNSISLALPFLNGGHLKRGAIFNCLLWILLVILLGPHLLHVDDRDAMAYLIPLLPGKYMQSAGTLYLRIRTCILPEYLPDLGNRELDCWTGRGHNDNHGNDMLVMASAAKSGAVLSARIVAEIGVSCNLCVASGERSGPGIPGPVEDLPTYDGKLLHAIINMRTWPDYVSNQGYDISTLKSQYFNNSEVSSLRVRCVSIIRDPLARLRSLYTYARSGGEHWFRYESGLMRQLSDPSLTMRQSLDLFWQSFGLAYLMQSHEYLVMNTRLGCMSVKMEEFHSNFSSPMIRILQHYGINEDVYPSLMERLQRANIRNKSDKQRQNDAHVTANKFSEGFIEEVNSILMQMNDVASLVKSQRLELGYR